MQRSKNQQNKSYLDLFLDNSIVKKRGIYFAEAQEEAIVKFNNSDTPNEHKVYLFEEIIEPAFRRIISGVLEMQKFHYLGRLNREELIENTFFRLIEKINKFQPDRIGKNGQPVKAYSYFSTMAKNFILEQIKKHNKILKNKADVESSIDLSILSEDTLKMMSNYDKQDVYFDTPESIFEETKQKIIKQIDEVLKQEEKKDKVDQDLIKIGVYLKYILSKWHKLEFMKKNEFMRILTIYTGLKQQQVSFLFKKFKISVLQKINPKILNKNIEEKDEEIEISNFSESNDEDINDKDIDVLLDEELEDKNKLNDFIPLKYDENGELIDENEDPLERVVSMEDFEIYMDKEDSERYKKLHNERSKENIRD